MKVIQPQMWHADVDYLRITHKAGPGLYEAENLYAEAVDKVASELILPAYRPEQWAWRGYYGQTYGSVAWGVGYQGAILQASGAAAASAVRLRLPYTGVPRIDLQTTYWLGADFPSLAHFVATETDLVRYGPKGPKWSCKVVDGRGSGDTCYIGRRGKRAKFLRVYDKWRQQKHAEDWRYAWRFEGEFTDDHAEYVLGTLLDTEMDHYTVLALLAVYWRERGVDLPEVTNGKYYRPSVIRKPPESLERTVKWLEDQVSPSLEKAYGLGLTRDQVRSILGL